jgi:hypothetical protein
MTRSAFVRLQAIALLAAVGCSSNAHYDGPAGDELQCAGGAYQADADLCWQDPKDELTFSWQEAVDYCAGLVRAGHDDWSLPAYDDFVSLLGDCDLDPVDQESSDCDTCFESDACRALFGDNETDWYWSSTTYGIDRAWGADLYDGSVKPYYLSFGNYVRCVRPGR